MKPFSPVVVILGKKLVNLIDMEGIRGITAEKTTM
jgi:hypothetical protein